MNYGFQNEKDFVELFNGKYLKDLRPDVQEFLINLFDGNIGNEETIKAWKNRINQKTDIFIKYKNYVRGVSLKYGSSNSMHRESIDSFKKYLEQLRIPYKVIEYYMSYHFGYKTDEFGKKDYTKVLSAEEYKINHLDELKIFNKYINKTRIIVDMIDRFIIRGLISDYDIDALVSGSVDDFVWILKHDIYDLILSNRHNKYTSPHIACLIIGPKTRNLDGNCKYRKDRYHICIKWKNIREDIINFKSKNKNTNN